MRHFELRDHRYGSLCQLAFLVLGLTGLVHSGCQMKDPYNQSPILGREVTMLLTSNIPGTQFRYRLQKLDAPAEQGWVPIGAGTQVEARLREGGRYEIAAKAEGYAEKRVKLTEPIKMYSFQFLAADRSEPSGPTPDPAVAQAPAPGEKAPDTNTPVDLGVSRKWAVVVGISEYRERGKWGLSNLRYARRDAEAMAKYLGASDGGRFDRVTPLLDEGATTQALRVALREDLRGVQENDLVLVYWAGHGMADPQEPDKLYLLGYDSDPAHLPSTAYAMDQFQRDIQMLGTHKVMIMADACHSAGLSDPAQAARGSTPNRIIEGLRGISVEAVPPTTPSPAGQCHLIFTSCEAGERSLESAELEGGHGIFTFFLLEGLHGAADRRDNNGNADGRVSLGEMIEYTVDKVRRFSLNRQHPDTAGLFDRDLALSQ